MRQKMSLSLFSGRRAQRAGKRIPKRERERGIQRRARKNSFLRTRKTKSIRVTKGARMLWKRLKPMFR